jgi:8-oxo-dGTP diphosphatase
MEQIWVAVGVIFDPNRGYFICRRAAHQHQGGKWEFPGGKVEQGESIQHALQRELREELGIDVKTSEPLMVIEHRYSDKAVKLDVWLVTEFSGEAKSMEGLENRWATLEELTQLNFPDANQPIIAALQQRAMAGVNLHLAVAGQLLIN